MRCRQKQRDLQRKSREESLDTRNGEGYFDLTAFKAVANIRREKQLNPVNKKERSYENH